MNTKCYEWTPGRRGGWRSGDWWNQEWKLFFRRISRGFKY